MEWPRNFTNNWIMARILEKYREEFLWEIAAWKVINIQNDINFHIHKLLVHNLD
jgi:hypothetical protein